MRTIHPLKHVRRVYCAGPLFNEAERLEMCRMAAALQDHGFTTFLPHADGMEFANVLPFLVDWGHDPAAAGRLLHEAIFAMDTYQVMLGCGSLVFNCNGRVPDEGAVAETTMAWMLGKPVVIFKEDVRSMISGRDNPLVVGQTGFQVVRDMDQLGPALEERIAAVPFDADFEMPCPAHLSPILCRGQQLCQRLAELGADRPPARVARIVLDLFCSDGKAGRVTRAETATAARP
jgi:nucleoside 2-deoxyribosyltransferase